MVLKKLVSLGHSIATEFSSNEEKNSQISNSVRMAKYCVEIKSETKRTDFINYCRKVVIPKEYIKENDSNTNTTNLTLDVRNHAMYDENNINQSIDNIISSCHLSLPPELSAWLFFVFFLSSVLNLFFAIFNNLR